MRTLSVNVARLDARSPVWVGRGLIASIGTLADLSHYTQVVVVADPGATATVTTVMSTLGLAPDRCLILTGGESCKSTDNLYRVWEFCLRHRLDRRSLIIGIGGGALTDLVGFAAATFMRGIAFIAIPTTLLAQVDASIGGKSGINFGGVKNILGAIRQPTGVIIDIDTLSTLSERDRRSGFAEIVKHGLIADKAYFDRVTSREHTAWSADELVDIVYRSCEIKRDVVESDESEQGPRKNLNFGHTLGHAIEALALAEGTPLTHGEAVAIGMHAAALISNRAGLLSDRDLDTTISGITRVGLPIHIPAAMEATKLQRLLELDKKNVGGRTRWTLLRAIGEATFNHEVADSLISEAIRAMQPRD